MTHNLLLASEADSIGGVVNALLVLVVSNGNVGALVSVAIMTVTIVWCMVQQVMFRFGRAFSPISRFAASLFVISSCTFALIVLHPASTVTAREALTMTFCFMVVTAVVACWSVFANHLEARIRRRHANEHSSG